MTRVTLSYQLFLNSTKGPDFILVTYYFGWGLGGRNLIFGRVLFLPTGSACYILYGGDLRFFAEGTQALQVQKRLVPGILAPLFEIKYGFGFANLLSATKFMFFNSFL